MTALLTFIIPVRHQDNAADWPALAARLTQTMGSIAGQLDHRWRGVIVANYGANLPPLPQGFDVVRVDFPPNPVHERGDAGLEEFYDVFRADKGRRVLAGMLAAHASRFFMVVDDDDFVSNRLAGLVAASPEANGWSIDKGFVWTEGATYLVGHDDFNRLCGTSLIVRSDLYDMPHSVEAADLEWVKAMLGSHVMLKPHLLGRGTPLATLPFRGAIYRVGHAGSHSMSRGALRDHLLDFKAVRRPRQWIRKLISLRRIGPSVRSEFFADSD